MSELGLFLVKPDAIKKGELQEAIGRIHQQGLEIDSIASVILNQEHIKNLYINKQDELSVLVRMYLENLTTHAIIVFGDECCRRLHVVRDGMRRDYGHDALYTGTHASDCGEDAQREIRAIGLISP